MAIDSFPYARLGLDKTLNDMRTAMFARLDEVYADYRAKGWLPAALNMNRGPFRGLTELAGFGLYQVLGDVTILIPQCFPTHATGSWLDLHAAGVLLERKPALQATGTIIFSRDKTSGNVKIPAGRLISTKPDGLGDVYRFVTTSDAVLLENSLSVTVPVIAENYGQASNVTPGAICRIVTAIAGVDSVENGPDWLLTEGADEEDDDSLRTRYVLTWKSISGLNKYFYESLALSVPGVSAVYVNDRHPRGQGTVDVVIRGAAGFPTSSLIDQVTQVIEEQRPQIDDIQVMGPIAVPVAISLTLVITSGDHTAIRDEVEGRLRALFNSPQKSLGVELLAIGQDLTHSRLHAEALKSPGVKSVLISSPASDLAVPPGGLATLEKLTLSSLAADL